MIELPVPTLIVDDNATFLRITIRFLREYSQSNINIVGTAATGAEAVQKAAELRPELILIDLTMPGVSGLDAIPQLRQLLPGCGIIAITLHDSADYRTAALDSGANEFVAKRSLSADLLPAITRVVQKVRGVEPAENGL